MEETPLPTGQIVLIAIAIEGALALAAVALGWLLGYEPLLAIAWDWRALGWGTVATLPPFLGFLWCVHGNWQPCHALTQLVRGMILPHFKGATPLDLLLISFSAGIGEELLFRGLLQAALSDWLSLTAGLILSSLLFGLAHCITPAYGIMATLIGAYLGGLWLLCDNLLAPIITHGLYDFLALAYLLHFTARDNELPREP